MIADANPIISWTYLNQNRGTFLAQLGVQAKLTVIAVAVGFAISLPVALAVWGRPRARGAVLGVAGALYTVPSLALFAVVQPIVGYFSTTSAEVALVSYTLLILVRNTLAGLEGIPPDVREAARAMGYTRLAELIKVDLPLALPSVFAGLRVATVTVVGLVTVTIFIGEDVLGQSIETGFQQSYNTPIVVALILSVLLAGVGDLLFVGLERLAIRWTPPKRRLR